MKKLFKRFLSALLVFSLSFNITSFANLVKMDVDMDISYKMEGNTVVERLIIKEAAGTTVIQRTVEPSGRAELVINGNETIIQQLDYEVFKNAATIGNTGYFSKNPRVDVHDSSKFTHTFMTRTSSTMYKNDILQSASLGIGFITTWFIKNGWVGYIASQAASLYLNYIYRNAPDIMVAEYEMYEVHFVDGTYYCYCYEYTAQGYDTGWGTVGKLEKDDVQQIG